MQRPVPLGKYLLLERISVGGMAEVFKARAFGVQGFAKLVAIKKILPHLAEDDRFVEMFIGEAKMAVQLSHTNIAQVIELGRAGDDHFIVMEYICGKDLLSFHHHLRKTKQRLPIELAAYIAARIAEGLDYAHRRIGTDGQPMGIVHRDISPQNVLVSHDGEVKLIDFGIAKARVRSYEATQAGVLKGKFGYMSPEQVVSKPVDSRSDIFALGTVLHELLTGKRLFFGENDFMTLEMVREAEVTAPSTLNPHVPETLDRIVLRALAKTPEARYQTAGEFSEDLMRFRHEIGAGSARQAMSGWMGREFSEHIEREKVRNEIAQRFTLGPNGEVVEAPPEEEEEPTALWSPLFEDDERDASNDSDWDSLSGDPDELAALPAFAAPTPAPSAFSSAATPPPRRTEPPPPRPQVGVRRRNHRPALALSALLLLAVGLGVGVQLWFSQGATGATGIILRVSPPDQLTIYLDGQVVAEQSPLVKSGVKPGTHRLRVERDGFESWDEPIEIAGGKLVEVNARLAPLKAEPARVRFVLEPPDARVQMNGRSITADREGYVTLSGGVAVEVQLTRDGFRTRTVRFVPQPGAQETVRYALERVGGSPK